MEMMTLKTPILSIFIGEGGSGGALALAVANEVWMLENAVYSVISPEGCASILWKDPEKMADAAQCLRLTANDLFTMEVIERIIREPKSADNPIFDSLRNLIVNTFNKYMNMSDDELLEQRYKRFRKYGRTTKVFSFDDSKEEAKEN